MSMPTGVRWELHYDPMSGYVAFVGDTVHSPFCETPEQALELAMNRANTTKASEPVPKNFTRIGENVHVPTLHVTGRLMKVENRTVYGSSSEPHEWLADIQVGDKTYTNVPYSSLEFAAEQQFAVGFRVRHKHYDLGLGVITGLFWDNDGTCRYTIRWADGTSDPRPREALELA